MKRRFVSKSVMLPMNAKIWADFARTTTISGLYYIHDAKHWLVKVLWFVIFVMLVMMTTFQCLGAVNLYLSFPTVINKRMDELNGSIYDTSSVSADQTNESVIQPDTMNFDQLCPFGYFKIEGGCYMQMANYPEEIWVGLYSLKNVNWIWSNGCPYDAFYPSFWGDTALRSQNAPLYNRLTERGVQWDDGTGSRDVICYKPVSNDDETCKLQGFQMKPNPPSILCHNSLVNSNSWWCVNDHPEYANVTSAVVADSCFCLLFDSIHFEMTADQAAVSCKLINASLADLKSAHEIDMLDQLIRNFDAEDGDLMNACPFNSTYANHSCFSLLTLISPSFTQADRNCYLATGGGRLMSVHSPYEHNAAFYEYCQKGRPWTLPSYGVYIGMYRNYSLNSTLWKWSDGTPFDYMPGWSIWVIPGQPDSSDPEAFFMYVRLFWTSLTMLLDNETSKVCTFWSNNNCETVDSHISI
uniref:C-type lectin domain-containing protein n=1 Tax=Romanomermis culicivorax TaxID=13658 RepID=A0A915KXK7_ROMCU